MVRITLDGSPTGAAHRRIRRGPDPRSYAIHDGTPPSVATPWAWFNREKEPALRLEAVGKNERSSGYSWGFDCLVLLPSTNAPASNERRGGRPD